MDQTRQTRILTDKPKMFALAIRLKPGQDPYLELSNLMKEKQIKAATILSMVGSFSKASIRFANQDRANLLEGPFEIVSATGTLGNGSMHIHLAVSDKEGKTVGGHLTSGSTVYTTCELVILDLSHEWSFERTLDKDTGYPELKPVR